VRPSGVIVWAVPGSSLSLIEFPADDPERARRALKREPSVTVMPVTMRNRDALARELAAG
jgi:hypothetical protein